MSGDGGGLLASHLFSPQGLQLLGAGLKDIGAKGRTNHLDGALEAVRARTLRGGQTPPGWRSPNAGAARRIHPRSEEDGLAT